MNSKEAITLLTELYGIEPEYTDIWGNRHVVPESTRLTLLKAIGLSIDSPGPASAILEKEILQLWQHRLDPVQVVRESDLPTTLTLRLPRHEEGLRFHWLLEEEDGKRHEGNFCPDELKRIESRNFNGEVFDRYILPVPIVPDKGYHRFILIRDEPGKKHETIISFIVTPDSCYLPQNLVGDDRTNRIWGLAVQLYSLRSSQNWGIGDFTDLTDLVQLCAKLGAGIVGINPIHGLFPHNPSHTSPYSPSSRLLINILYLDIEAIPDFTESKEACDIVSKDEFQQHLNTIRQGDIVDYSAVATVKLRILNILYRSFRKNHLLTKTNRGESFYRFIAEGGEFMKRLATFEALQDHFYKKDRSIWGWPAWPEPYRDPDGRAVRNFEATKGERIEFYQYLQWQADIQLHNVSLKCSEHNLPVGLYLDLAVSIDRGGAEAWANQELYALDIGIGAPPDDFSLNGQNWELPPMIPKRLRDTAYLPFITTLRHNMRHAGAIRIDHIMTLMRLFWIPLNKPSREGTYVHYPFDDLMGILALESERNKCLVIGEDLGTVPDAVRKDMVRWGVFSYKIFYFEKTKEGEFKTPDAYQSDAVVSVSTHDLPTLRGYWEGIDLALRKKLNLFPSKKILNDQLLSRELDRALLLKALEHVDLLPEETTTDPASMPELTTALSRAIHTFLARTPCKIQMVQLEDMLNQPEQANIPGTTNQYPNWRRKLCLDLHTIVKDSNFISIEQAINRERGTGLLKRADTVKGR